MFVCVVSLGVPLSTLAAFDHVRGRILLDVETNGEAWYVMPTTYKRYSLGRPEEAFNVMRTLSLGVSDANLSQIPKEEDFWEGSADLRKKLAGQLLLQVEQHGEVWYVNPVDQKRYFLGRPADALRVMRKLGLGITHANLQTIPLPLVVAPYVVQNVSFAAQAPFGEWNDIYQAEGCEEASAIMAVNWARGETLSKEEFKERVIAISKIEEELYGEFRDTSIEDTANHIVRGALNYQNIRVVHNVSVQDIAQEVSEGSVVLVGTNGRVLKNPYYTGQGPLQHMVAVIGYDPFTDSFITHDPGTRFGANTLYTSNVLQAALLDYPTGWHEKIIPGKTGMIVVFPKN